MTGEQRDRVLMILLKHQLRQEVVLKWLIGISEELEQIEMDFDALIDEDEEPTGPGVH